jgi:hypothetical protein
LIVDLERSRLAAAVPSFVDRERALADPVVRARLDRDEQPTRPDMEAPVKAAGRLWHLRYRDRTGRWRGAQATTQQVVRRLREGRVPAVLEARPEGRGVFRPLESYPEFARIETVRPKRTEIDDGRQNGSAGEKLQPAVAEVRPADEEKANVRPWLLLGGVLLAAASALGFLVYVWYRFLAGRG